MRRARPFARRRWRTLRPSAVDIRRRKPWTLWRRRFFGSSPGAEIVHPRPYGAFTRKLRLFALEDSVITLPFAVRSMTSLAWTFLGIGDRGLIKPGFSADIAAFDVAKIRDHATYQQPHQYSTGTVHVLVNGRFALRDGNPTTVLGGRPILRGGRALQLR